MLENVLNQSYNFTSMIENFLHIIFNFFSTKYLGKRCSEKSPKHFTDFLRSCIISSSNIRNIQ